MKALAIVVTLAFALLIPAVSMSTSSVEKYCFWQGRAYSEGAVVVRSDGLLLRCDCRSGSCRWRSS